MGLGPVGPSRLDVLRPLSQRLGPFLWVECCWNGMKTLYTLLLKK